MTISLFELFSIGIGPSSSHTVGPMRAAKDFVMSLGCQLEEVAAIEIIFYGSLAFTGRGHQSDIAVQLGLLGEEPQTIDPNQIELLVKKIFAEKNILLNKKKSITFDPQKNLIFDTSRLLDFHSNSMQFSAYTANQKIIKREIYYSIGGGFIMSDAERKQPQKNEQVQCPCPFTHAADLLRYSEQQNLSFAQVMLENEKIWRNEQEIRAGILHIAQVMEQCLQRGCVTAGILAGGLQVRRRAPELYQKLCALGKPDRRHPQIMAWLDCYAMAVNEENAAGGRVVTAPTNGAAGIVPAVLQYYKQFCEGASESHVIDFLLTAAAIGILYKKNASISGAEMGCQGEVGVACSMAAGALAAVLGGNMYQVENAAEIAMEHNLGLTCDPVNGLVQIPCIERNAIGANTAVNAAQLALLESGKHKISLDRAITAMRDIGIHMNANYKETAKGGLAIAVNVPEC